MSRRSVVEGKLMTRIERRSGYWTWQSLSGGMEDDEGEESDEEIGRTGRESSEEGMMRE